MAKKLTMACDHAGFGLKELIKDYLIKKGYEITDRGTFSEESCDYPDFAHLAAKDIETGMCDAGIALCGTGNGIQMTLNKHQKIRAALCWMPEIAELARQHNDANFLVMPARFIDKETAFKIVDIYLSTDFEGGRHCRRVNKIPVSVPVEGEVL